MPAATSPRHTRAHPLEQCAGPSQNGSIWRCVYCDLAIREVERLLRVATIPGQVESEASARSPDRRGCPTALRAFAAPLRRQGLDPSGPGSTATTCATRTDTSPHHIRVASRTRCARWSDTISWPRSSAPSIPRNCPERTRRHRHSHVPVNSATGSPDLASASNRGSRASTASRLLRVVCTPRVRTALEAVASFHPAHRATRHAQMFVRRPDGHSPAGEERGSLGLRERDLVVQSRTIVRELREQLQSVSKCRTAS